MLCRREIFVCVVVMTGVSVIVVFLALFSVSTLILNLAIPTVEPNMRVHADNTTVLLPVELGSSAYYSLPTTQKAIISQIRDDNLLLQSIIANPYGLFAQFEMRGILVYLPPGSDQYNAELKALLLSVAIMRVGQTAHTRTDLLVGTPPGDWSFLYSIDCIAKARTNFDEPEACRIVSYVPLADRPADHPLLLYKGYVDSVLVLAEFNNTANYDFLLRTDIDTLVTPAFAAANLLPASIVIATGLAGYNSEVAIRHLNWMMKKVGLENVGDVPGEVSVGIGSTWFGRSAVLVALAKLSVSSMIWLHTQEFTEYERGPASTDGWPNWHWPVLTMYGGHVAVKQVRNSAAYRTTLNDADPVKLDQGTNSIQPLANNIIHIHCWHTEEIFSKFAFHRGDYVNISLLPYLDMNTTQSFAMTVAISSSRLTPQKLALLVKNYTAISNKEWIRV